MFILNSSIFFNYATKFFPRGHLLKIEDRLTIFHSSLQINFKDTGFKQVWRQRMYSHKIAIRPKVELSQKREKEC